MKVHQYINITLADLEVKSQNPDALAILLDMNGNIAEGPGSNFFVVKDGVVTTPREQNVLSGISRQVALELAHELNIEAREADIDLYGRLHSRRGIRDIHQLLYLPGLLRKRQPHRRQRCPRTGD